MEKQYITITNNDIAIPAVLWGKSSKKLLIEVHGNLSNKEDTVISIMARKAVEKGYQVLSFDLPLHGERKDNADYDCNPQNCVNDLTSVYRYAQTAASEISLFACSMGAYFSLLAYHDFTVRQSLFLSPVVNMKQIILNMMQGFHISEERLKEEKRIPLPIGQTLDWEYYRYVRSHPITFDWIMPTSILYGSDDNLTSHEDISSFAARYQASVKVLEHGEHFFHTEEQLKVFEDWAEETLL